MDNNTGPANQQNIKKPQLKKVKRPINRIMPQKPHNFPLNETQDSFEQNKFDTDKNLNIEPFQHEELKETIENNNLPPTINAVDLDAYLDDNAKLPAQNNIPENFDNSNTPKFLEEEDLITGNYSFGSRDDLPPYLTKKILILLGVVLFFVGILAGRFLFSEEKVVRNGLQGVVVNPEVPRGRARCGVAERTQGCVLYIMNPQRQELNARDFYDLASQLTGRQRFVIETGNMRYSNTKIRPGNIVQLNIPPI